VEYFSHVGSLLTDSARHTLEIKVRNAMAKATLTLIPLTWKIWWAANNASKWQMGFNSAFKGL